MRRPDTTLVSAALLAVALAVALAAAPARAQDEEALLESMDVHHPVWAAHGMVASQEEHATRVGVEALRRGGNAVDAAVAVGFALAVTLPRAGNLGGGGFMLVHLAGGAPEDVAALDFRETAPAAAHRDLFLDEAGEVVPERSRFTHLAVAVPGTVAGLAAALARWGTLPLAEVVAPAVRLAEEGFPVSAELARTLAARRDRLASRPATAAIYLRPDGTPWRPGDTLVQRDLARTLRAVATRGPDAFYRGETARLVVAEMERGGGLVTMEDLAGYAPVVRRPVVGTYRGDVVVSMPPPSSGGVHLLQVLNLLEAFPLGYLGANGAETIHLMAEAAKLAYADRAVHLGDPDRVAVPVAGLVSKAYADELRPRIDRLRATPAATIAAGDPLPHESPDTTHYSVVDRHGNAVATTYTLNFSYGSFIVAPGTGTLLNNEMDDFAAKPGVPNAYGLVGGDANAVAGGKRPLSSMTPTIVFRDGKPFLLTGSPGGSRIITTVLQLLVNVLDHGMNVAEATHACRVHHQWLPDELRVEDCLSPDTLRLLADRGHHLAVRAAMGSTQTIQITPEGLLGASDPRRPDALTAGH